MKTTVYKTDGTQSHDIDLPENLFNVAWNGDLVHQVLSAQRFNRRTATTHTKDRSDRRGGGAKPWRQKGTGRARHGSRRSPIWRKGGVTHGPRNEQNNTRTIPSSMRRKALYALLSQKYRDDEVVFIDAISIDTPKTQYAKKIITDLGSIQGIEDLAIRQNNVGYIALPSYDEATSKSFRNFGNISIDEIRNLNVMDVAEYKYIIIVNPERALSVLGGNTDETNT